jgi:hypothetical protein
VSIDSVNTKKNDKVRRAIALDMRMFSANLDNMRIETTMEYNRINTAILIKDIYLRLLSSVQVIESATSTAIMY